MTLLRRFEQYGHYNNVLWTLGWQWGRSWCCVLLGIFPFGRCLRLPSSPFPLHKVCNLGMSQQLLPRIVVTANFLFIGDQVVDGLMAGLAEVQPLSHLLPAESSFEPLVRVQGARDEMVEVVGFFTAAEFAVHGIRLTFRQYPSVRSSVRTACSGRHRFPSHHGAYPPKVLQPHPARSLERTLHHCHLEHSGRNHLDPILQ
jgi:hypothetical protein